MEHLHHFQLSEDPFRSDPLEKFDIALPSQQQALARLDRGVRQGKGLLLLVGEVGSGKTHVARQLYEALEEEVFEAGMLVVLRHAVDTDWLLARLARQLGVDEPEREREALIGQIYERMSIIHEDGRRAVLIIDDAHALANPDTLAALCGLVKLEYEDRRLLTVVLVGAPPLDSVIYADPLLAHHVDVRVHLAPLGREETADYLAARIQVAGGDPLILLPGASVALQELADGAPGRLNVLADNALYEAWTAQRTQLTRSDVERAHRDLGWVGVGAAPAAASGSTALTGTSAPIRSVAARSRLASAQAELTQAEVRATDFDVQAEAEPRRGAAGGAGSAEAIHTVVMDFDAPATPSRPAKAARRGVAEATRIEFEEPDAPPKEGDEVDDLFMELLDD